MSLSKILESLTRGSLRNILEGAGLTLATAGASITILNTAIDYFRDQITQAPPMLLAFMNLAGFDICFSIILGAYVARYIQDATRVQVNAMRR